MALETDALCGPAHGERTAERINQRNGSRDRDWETRAGTVELRILKPELNSKRGEGACNLLISFIWSLDFFRTWCHACLFIRLECCL